MCVIWNLVMACFEIVLVSVQCTIKYTIGSEIILSVPIVLLRDEAHVEARFGPFGDSVSVAVR
jgi:hypothetical protein